MKPDGDGQKEDSVHQVLDFAQRILGRGLAQHTDGVRLSSPTKQLTGEPSFFSTAALYDQ